MHILLAALALAAASFVAPGPAPEPPMPSAGANGAASPRPAGTALLPAVEVPAGYRFELHEGEFRGAWLHWQDFRSPEAIARAVARARKAGLNTLLPLANYPHQAMWQSALIPVYSALPAGYDPLRELVEQGHAAGLTVIPYVVMLHGGLTKHPNYAADWFAVDRHGRRVDNWLNPAHPEVRAFLVSLIREIAATGCDGIQYDYIRHEYDTDYDYGDYTRQAFHAAHRFDPLALYSGGTGGTGMRLLKTGFHRAAGESYFAAIRTFVEDAGYRPSAVLEENLPQLRRDTLLVCGNLYAGRTKGETIEQMLRHVGAGGAAIILDGPEAVRTSSRLAEAAGIQSPRYVETRADTLSVVAEHPVTAGIPATIPLRVRGNICSELAGGTPLVQFGDGTPAVVASQYGRGRIVTIGFHCYQAEAAGDAAVLRLFHNAVEWLCSQQQITNTTRTSASDLPGARQVWDRWRVEQVSSLVAECSAAAREVNPRLVIGAAGGTQTSDLARVKRDGQAWLEAGSVDFLCPMAYTRDNDVFRRRLQSELAPLREARHRQVIYPGIAAYQMGRAPQRVIEQVTLARRAGFRGTCLFSFESLSDEVISRLRSGPFQREATVPWRVVEVGR